MVKVQHFSESLEGNFKNLGFEIERQRKSSEIAKLPEREVVKHAIKSITNAQVSDEVDKKETEQEDKEEKNLPSYLSAQENPDIAREVEALIKIAFTKDIFEATKKAKSHSAFIQDALHDALVDKLLPELKKRGLL